MVSFMRYNHGSGEDPGIYFDTPFSVVRKVMFMCVIYVFCCMYDHVYVYQSGSLQFVG